jgi:hypothetical protein
MEQLLQNIDWNEVILTLWTVVLLPVLTYIANEIREWAKSKKIDKYTDILQKNVVNAVKDMYETVVKDIKHTDNWTLEKQEEVKELAKAKAIQALTNSAYECLKTANGDFEEYLDGLVGTSLFDIKNGLK